MWLVSPCCPDFVSICNVWRLFGPVTVTDRDIPLMLLGWGCNVFRPPHPLFPPLTDMFYVWLLHKVIMDRCTS